MRPNLPDNNIKSAFVSQIMPCDIRNELLKLGVQCVDTNTAKYISTELKYHPDIVMLNTEEGVWYTEKSNEQMFVFGEIKRLNRDLGDIYPSDCLLNHVIAGNTVICGKSADTSIFGEGKEIIRVNQSYAKCSTIIINERAFITSDKSIYKALKIKGFDVLLTVNDGIELNGYSCGFIGGCAGKISKDTVVFTGDIKKHKDADNIKRFCANYQTQILSLCSAPLYDYGGILPIE